jgi:acetyl-CoA C-acetyltransferase
MEAYIVAGARTAVGKFNGTLTTIDATELGAAVIKEALVRASLSPDKVDEVIMGNVIQAGLGQNPARQAGVKSGVSQETPAFTVNRVCGSGIATVGLGSQAVALGEAEIIIAGGMENMSAAPYLMKAARWGMRMGNGELVDSMLQDGLMDAFNRYHMGITAENVAEKFGVSRQDQDTFSVSSQQKAEKAIKTGRFKEEITPLSIPQQKGEALIFDTDEFPRYGTTLEALAKLKPAFKKDGTVTAGNSSGINDGAGAVTIVSKKKLADLKPNWAFQVLGCQAVGLDPAYMGLGPISATKKLLAKLKLTINDLDLIEVNEAFAAQSVQVHREMGWDMDKVNVNGGAIALGHPVGASGTRILITLIFEMLKRDSNIGLASLCVGGGQGMAIAIQRVR